MTCDGMKEYKGKMGTAERGGNARREMEKYLGKRGKKCGIGHEEK